MTKKSRNQGIARAVTRGKEHKIKPRGAGKLSLFIVQVVNLGDKQLMKCATRYFCRVNGLFGVPMILYQSVCARLWATGVKGGQKAI